MLSILGICRFKSSPDEVSVFNYGATPMKTRKKLVFLILSLTILSLIIPVIQAADQISIKNDTMKTSGQAMVLYPWNPITTTRVLPFNYEIPAVPGNNLSVTASRGEFEPASFIIRAQKDLTGIQIGVPNLRDNQGNSIPGRCNRCTPGKSVVSGR